MTEKDEPRMVDSQLLIRQAMAEAMGLYMAKEPKHGDEWRDKTVQKNFLHLKHEVEEIERSTDMNRQLHNALDACGQAAILAASIRLKMGSGKDKAYLLHGGHEKGDSA